MNETPIEFCDYTWNPVTGCTRGCPYCYAMRMVKYGRLRGHPSYPHGFKLTFHPKRINEPKRRLAPSIIFAVSMGDILDVCVFPLWIVQVIAVARECPWHTFLFLTKNPGRYLEFAELLAMAGNIWIGTSATSREIISRNISHLVAADIEAERITGRGLVKFLVVEPFVGVSSPLTVADPLRVDWIIVGGLTGPRPAQPTRVALLEIIKQCRDGDCPVFIKDNVGDALGKLKHPREFPSKKRLLEARKIG